VRACACYLPYATPPTNRRFACPHVTLRGSLLVQLSAVCSGVLSEGSATDTKRLLHTLLKCLRKCSTEARMMRNL
jgi:hypothetical protein